MASFRTIIHCSTCLALVMATAGCSWIGRQADALGSHMPVIGERCEHWQCITKSGRQTSDMYKQQMEQEEVIKKDGQQQPEATGSTTPAYPGQ